VVFDFQMGRGREGPRKFLEGYRGKLQTDGYQAYDDGVGGPGMVHAGCWGHARRGFVDAVKVNKNDMEAVQMVRGWTRCSASIGMHASRS
jgi:transposase